MGNYNYKTSPSTQNSSLISISSLKYSNKSPDETNTSNINNLITISSFLLNECITNQVSNSNNLSIFHSQNISIIQKDCKKNYDNINMQTKYLNSIMDSFDIKQNCHIFKKSPSNIECIDTTIKQILSNSQKNRSNKNPSYSTLRNSSRINSNNFTLQNCHQKNKINFDLNEKNNNKSNNNSITSISNRSSLDKKIIIPKQQVIYSVNYINEREYHNKHQSKYNKNDNSPNVIRTHKQKSKDKFYDIQQYKNIVNSVKIKNDHIKNQLSNEPLSNIEKVSKRNKPQTQSYRNKTPIEHRNYSNMKIDDKRKYISMTPEGTVRKKRNKQTHKKGYYKSENKLYKQDKYNEDKDIREELFSKKKKFHENFPITLKINEKKKLLKNHQREIKEDLPNVRNLANSALEGNSESQKKIFTIIQDAPIYESHEEEIKNKRKPKKASKPLFLESIDENVNETISNESYVINNEQYISESFSFNQNSDAPLAITLKKKKKY